MTKLRFETAKVREILAELEKKKQPRELYGQRGAEKGFWLVGDQGVYLMHNCEFKGKANVAYAAECNPETLPFDEWWENKREIYGGDDGVDFWPIESIKVAMKITADPRYITLKILGNRMEWVKK